MIFRAINEKNNTGFFFFFLQAESPNFTQIFYLFLEVQTVMKIILFEMSFHKFFVPKFLILLDWGIGLVEHPLVFSGCRFLQRNQSSFCQKHSSDLEYIQKGNISLGYHLVFSG